LLQKGRKRKQSSGVCVSHNELNINTVTMMVRIRKEN